ncbi:MAG: phosphopantetheine-binding protein [Proteobacteria bacterium]|nr:phosphopantetheine-binding protein [Pseudomonadota bacterium]
MNENDALIQELAKVILEAVNMHHIDASTLNADTHLKDTGLGLDSIDLLEAVLTIEAKYKVKIKSPEEGKKHFQTLGTLAAFIKSNHENK